MCVAEAESMATVYPAARNLCAAVTYTRSRNCSLPNRAGHPHEDIEKNGFVRVTEKQTLVLVEQREDMVCVCVMCDV